MIDDLKLSLATAWDAVAVVVVLTSPITPIALWCGWTWFGDAARASVLTPWGAAVMGLLP